ncbi:MAG TPA: hypothetical protein DEB06_08590 [Phycisphaerales bacterium]|nr:hypothetical protein [Phycisphaerales bacterium]
MNPTPAQRRRGLRGRHAASEAPLYAGIFMVFASFGSLIAMVMGGAEPWGWLAGAAGCVFSGMNALIWAHMFSRRRWWLFLVVGVLPFIAGPLYFNPLHRMGVFEVGAAFSPFVRRVVLATMGVTLISCGFTLIIWYVTRRERQAAAFGAELDVAQRLHAALVPEVDRRVGALEIFGVSHPSSEMGGDLIDIVERESQVDLVLADVSGHGVGAGVVMAMVKAAERMRLTRPEGPPLDGFLTDLNRLVTQLTSPEMFVTLAVARLSLDGQRAEVGLAGHLPVLHWIASEKRVARIENASLPLGITLDERFAPQIVTISPGDALVLYTDGLIESSRPDGEQFGLVRLAAEVARLADAPARAMGEGLIRAARAFGGSGDDQSVLVVRAPYHRSDP